MICTWFVDCTVHCATLRVADSNRTLRSGLIAKHNVLVFVCVCILRYPACNAHAPYCHLWPARLYSIFPHYLINGTILGKKLLNTKCVFWFSVQLLSATFLILRRIKRDMIRTVYRSACRVQLLLLLEFSETGILSTDFRKILKYKISWKSVQWESSCSMRTDGRTDMTKLIVSLHYFAYAPKIGRADVKLD